MASENLALDENGRNGLGAITNDASEFLKNLRVNPSTGRLLVDAHLTSTNTEIGDTIPGGTAGSVLFLGVGSTLEQDNAHFFWDDTNNRLGIGTNTPAETLHVAGTAIITGDVGTADQLLGRDSGTGEITGITVGSGLSLSGNTLTATGVSSGVSQIIAGTDISISPMGGTGVVTVNVDTAALATDTNFIDDLIANSYFTTTLANDSNFISELTSNSTFQSDVVTFINSSGSLSVNLATQVTGVLPIANGGTNSSTALSGSSIMISNGSAIVQGPAGTTTTVLHGNASGAPTYGAVSLTADVSGTLPVTNGGTNATSFTAYAVICGGTTSTGALQSVASVGTAGQVLTSNGAGALPTFQTLTASIAFKSGEAGRAGDAASGNQVIAHGLGTTPSIVKFTAWKNQPNSGSNVVSAQAYGTYNGTDTVGIYETTNSTISTAANGTSTTYIVTIWDGAAGSNGQQATITVDATNITLAWTKTGSPASNTINLLWEVYA